MSALAFGISPGCLALTAPSIHAGTGLGIASVDDDETFVVNKKESEKEMRSRRRNSYSAPPTAAKNIDFIKRFRRKKDTTSSQREETAEFLSNITSYFRVDPVQLLVPNLSWPQVSETKLP